MSNPRSTVVAVLALIASFALSACDPRPGTPPSTPMPKTGPTLTS
jgi:hypothetical protein